MIRNLQKQVQLIEIELGDYAIAKRQGRPAIHPEIYYAKLGHVYLKLTKSIQLLSSLNKDIYNNFNYLKQ